jgi:hypothetical protein
VVRLLLRAKATVDMATKRGLTAVFFAADRGHASVVEVLMDAGATPGALHPFEIWGTISILSASNAPAAAEVLKRLALHSSPAAEVSQGWSAPQREVLRLAIQVRGKAVQWVQARSTEMQSASRLPSALLGIVQAYAKPDVAETWAAELWVSQRRRQRAQQEGEQPPPRRSLRIRQKR